jgi:dinuclear metal center YbgI/SA1388 family protein
LYNAWILVRVAQISEVIETIAPSTLAEEWDNCGLQVGDPEAEVNRVLVALTPLPEVFEEAEEKGANFLLFHHPLIFDPLKAVVTSSYPGGLLARAIRNGLAVYAAHTSYDAEVGAGVIGDYAECTFRTLGRGTFRGGEGASPYLGEKGRLEEVEELRIETVVAAHTVGRAVNAATAAHPYEEVALDVYPVEGSPDGCGYGRVGTLPERLTAVELREYVTESLGFPSRLLADPGRRVETVAVLGGSGGSFIPEVAASGAHAYVTGDVDYHEALLAESLDLAVIDAGHAATELPSLEPLALRLTELVDVPVEVSRVLR